ncbi:MAG: AmmeMemoRadiSam system protein A [Candidatus Binatia bacterium]
MDGLYIPFSSQRKLLHLARQALEGFVRNALRLRAEIDDPYLQIRDRGVFVSLHKKGELRGCIGIISASGPLYETVIDMTEAAASRDNRVKPVRESELDKINLDISILSRLEPTDQPLSLVVGRHGVHVAQGLCHGLLLPQVAAEYRWDTRTFLEQTCVKAGLCKDAWQEEGTHVSSFTALVIEEQPWNGAVSSGS